MLTLYVNGDSHAAAAECVNPYAWAQDDELYWGLGKQPHPDNARASFGCELANYLNAILELDAQAGGSNQRIIRTTRNWLEQQHRVDDVFVVVQWSTWERQEWFHAGEWWQVNASGVDHVPDELQDQYREFVIGVDWQQATESAHRAIWDFHQELDTRGVRHLFFNGNSHFGSIEHQHNWGDSYLQPYDAAQTYTNVLKNNGFATVSPESWHFGADAHCFWAEYLLQYINSRNLINSNEIPTN
jgi:hypothetical protein